MPAISRISTVDLVAKILGQNRDRVFDLACDQLEPEDGLIWIYDTDNRETVALTENAIEMLRQIIAEQNQD